MKRNSTHYIINNTGMATISSGHCKITISRLRNSDGWPTLYENTRQIAYDRNSKRWEVAESCYVYKYINVNGMGVRFEYFYVVDI